MRSGTWPLATGDNHILPILTGSGNTSRKQDFCPFPALCTTPHSHVAAGFAPDARAFHCGLSGGSQKSFLLEKSAAGISGRQVGPLMKRQPWPASLSSGPLHYRTLFIQTYATFLSG